MSTTQRQSVIKLIEKKGKDKLFIKNWRPLMMINFDSKLWAKVQVSKLIKVIAKLIHPNQVAYIKGRYIGEGVRVIEGVIEYLKTTNSEGYLLAIDFEKAFDSLEWDFLWDALRAYGFPECFIFKLQILYNDIQACVSNGGTTTPFFDIKRGVKQGDPPSGYLFILAIELLLIRIRENKAIEGIEINRMEYKLSAYADDLLNFLRNLTSVRITLQELASFKLVSGL